MKDLQLSLPPLCPPFPLCDNALSAQRAAEDDDNEEEKRRATETQPCLNSSFPSFKPHSVFASNSDFFALVACRRFRHRCTSNEELLQGPLLLSFFWRHAAHKNVS